MRKILLPLFFGLLFLFTLELGYYFYLVNQSQRQQQKPTIKPKADITLPVPNQKQILTLENKQPEFIISADSAFGEKEIEKLIKKYGKNHATLKIVASRDDIPLGPDGGYGGVGTRLKNVGITYAEMAEYRENGVILYFYPEVQSIKKAKKDPDLKNFNIEQTISLAFLRALANNKPHYLLPQGEDLFSSNSEDFKKYTFIEPFLFKVSLQ